MEEQTILQLAATMFVTQLFFIWFRTLNVRFVARGNIWGAIWTGFIVHITWLIGIAIGTVSIVEMVKSQDVSYWPVIACSMSAGAIGTYFAMKRKLKQQKNKT